MFASTLYVPGLKSSAKRCVPNWFSFWVLKTLFSVVWMLELDMLGSKTNTFDPRFGVFDWAGQLLPAGLTTQLNVAFPEAPVVSVAVTVTLEVAAVVGVPVTRPEEEIDSPAGRPVAVKVSV